tara:strand:+ start:1167 stop:1643 length:477 start_codon:yes stop_codon:yes gene_type:complete
MAKDPEFPLEQIYAQEIEGILYEINERLRKYNDHVRDIGTPGYHAYIGDNGWTENSFQKFIAATELTIATGAVTATQTLHKIDTESDAATDDLDTISGGVEGYLLIIYPEDSARTVVAKDGTGNLSLAGDFSMDHADDRLTLLHDGTNWVELSRSSNA